VLPNSIGNAPLCPWRHCGCQVRLGSGSQRVGRGAPARIDVKPRSDRSPRSPGSRRIGEWSRGSLVAQPSQLLPQCDQFMARGADLVIFQKSPGGDQVTMDDIDFRLAPGSLRESFELVAKTADVRFRCVSSLDGLNESCQLVDGLLQRVSGNGES